MNRASPADLRKTLEAANTLTKAGIMFICMPVLDEQDGLQLVAQAAQRLDQLASQIEAQDGKN